MGEGRELCSQASLAIGPCASSSCSRPVCCLDTWPEPPQEPPRKSCSRTSHPVSKDGCESSCFCTEPPRRSCQETYGARPVLGRRRRSLRSCNVGVPTLRKRGEGSMREPPTAAAERRKVCYVPMLRRGPATSNADELDAVPKRQSSLPR